MVSCIAGSFYTAKVDIYEQQTSINEETNEPELSWTFYKTVRAYVFPYIAGGLRGMGSNETFGERYANTDYLRLKTFAELDKRWRVSNIRNAKTDAVIYREHIDGPPTVYNVDGSAPIENPLSGKVIEWLTTLRRAEVQGNG